MGPSAWRQPPWVTSAPKARASPGTLPVPCFSQSSLWDLRRLQSGVLLQAGLGLAAFSSPFCSGSLQKAFDPSLPSLGPMAKA